MRSAADLLPGIEFAERATLLPALNQLAEKLTALQAESWDALHKPKKARRATLSKDYADVADALLVTLEKVSANLAAAVNHNDPVIDQLLSIKQAAWLLRSTAGEASDLVSTGLMSTGSTTLETQLAYTKLVGGIDATWSALELSTWGMQLSAGPGQRDGLGQDRLFRSAIHGAARSSDGRRRESAKRPKSPPIS